MDADSPQRPEADIEAVARSDAFARLTARRTRFTAIAGGLFLAYFLTVLLLSGYARSFMGERIWSGLTVGYLLAALVIVAVWVLAFAYLRFSDDVLDPLAEEARRP